MAKSGAGRPSFPEGEARDQVLQCRVREAELERIRAAAEAEGKSLSEWMRETLLAAANRRRTKSTKKKSASREGSD
jgi:hypothetical protein